MENYPVLLAILDDHTLFRYGLSKILGEFKEIRVIWHAGSGQEMKTLMSQKTKPQIILMDISMPDMDGYEATQWIKQKYPLTKILALTMIEDDLSVIKMLQCGASGYMVKESRPQDLLEAIVIIHEKGYYINELVTGKLIRTLRKENDLPKITEKEVQFMKYCCSELTYKEIADRMFVSHRTIDNYRESLFQKLNLKSRTGLVLYAMHHQLHNFSSGKNLIS